MTTPHSDSTAGDATFEWELEVTDSPLVQRLAYVFPSILGGVVLLAGGLLGWLVIEAVRTGDLVRAVGLVGIALLGLVTRRYLPALLTTTITDPFREQYSRWGLILGSVLGLIVLLASVRLYPIAPFVVFVASWIPLVLTAAFPTTGHANLETEQLVVNGTEVPLETIRCVRGVSMGAFVVCWLSYSRGVPSAPRIIMIPVTLNESVGQMLDRASESTGRRQSTIGWTERLITGLFGLGMVAAGPLLWFVLPPGDGQLIALYAGALFGLFGIIFLWYAYSA